MQHFADLSSSIVITEYFQPALNFFCGNIKLLKCYKIQLSNITAGCQQKLVSIIVITTFQEL